jgi:sirohydrochlorin cobaltochelatase
MTGIILLAMHGAPPNDFPPRETTELFNLHFQLEHMPKGVRPDLEARYTELDAKMRAWPRNASNDPFYRGSQELAAHLRQASGQEVVVGFNEFCAPTLAEAFALAADSTPGQIVVITPMMTRGGEHSEVDIPEAIQQAQRQHPGIEILYAWPLDPSQIACFLADQIDQITSQNQRR